MFETILLAYGLISVLMVNSLRKENKKGWLLFFIINIEVLLRLLSHKKAFPR